MPLTIWKYEVPVQDEFTLKLPKGAKPLSVRVQHDIPQLWVLCDPDAPTFSRSFATFGTGHHRIPENIGDFVRTFFLQAGSLVFHLFETR